MAFIGGKNPPIGVCFDAEFWYHSKQGLFCKQSECRLCELYFINCPQGKEW